MIEGTRSQYIFQTYQHVFNASPQISQHIILMTSAREVDAGCLFQLVIPLSQSFKRGLGLEIKLQV